MLRFGGQVITPFMMFQIILIDLIPALRISELMSPEPLS